MNMQATHTYIAHVQDKPGVLTKIASIFYRRGMNIHTLLVEKTQTPDVSKITFRVSGTHEELHRLRLSIQNLVDVVSIDLQ